MFHNLVNTAQFSYTARDFKKNGGQYTKAPVGSREYIDFWEEEERRCRDGYTVGGLWIPGRYYGYLNFSVMSKVPDNVALKAYEERKDGKGKISVKTAEKILDFPRFWEPQYEWFMFKHIAWHGGSFMGINSPGGKHIGCLKARGGGFSYMEAWDGVYNYNFIPGSLSYYFAGIEDYLIVDGVLNKVQPMLDWINKHIYEWKQNRQKHNSLQDMHFKASYYDAFGVEQGSLSEIIGVSIHEPNKAHPHSAIIYTPKGQRSWKDIQVGDKVFGANGKPIEVLGTYEQGERDIYIINFDDGRTAQATWDHLWNVQFWVADWKTGKQKLVARTLTTAQLSERLSLPTTRTNRIKIALPQATDYSPQDTKIDPYTLGLLLGDGTLKKATRNRVNLTMKWADIDNIAHHIPYTIQKDNWGGDIRNTILIPEARTKLQFLGLDDKTSGDKFIPDSYKYNTQEVRFGILNGLLDTDGSCTSDCGVIEYSTKSPQLAKDFMWIVYSLGFGGTIKERIINGTVYFRCYLYCLPGENRLFNLTRKKRAIGNKTYTTKTRNKAQFIHVKSIEFSHKEQAKCIMVDAPDHLYLIDNHIITHNTRGKRGRKILFEEGGSFKNLKKALDISLGSIKDGDIYVGQQTVLGTGGEEGPGIEGLEEVFDSPEVFDMLEFPNVWEEGELAETTCGYFCPAYRVNNAAIDGDGNVDVEIAITSEKKTRERKKKSKDPKALDNYIAEYPWTPQEALKRLTNNPFKVTELNKQIRYVRNSPMIQSLFRYGYLERDRKGKPKFIIQTKEEARPIETYPHKRGDDLKGCVTIIEQPFTNEVGIVPYKLYQVIVDTYAIEETSEKEDTGTNESLYSIQVFKNYNSFSTINEGLPVAWFRGRRDNIDDIHEIAIMLSEMFNTTIQGEIGGGGQGLVNYARQTQKLHLLENEPEMAHNRDYQSKGRQGSYLMAMPADKKRLGITYVRDWHQEAKATDEKGNTVMRLHRWYDIVGLMELAKFNGKRNADTLSCLIIAIIMLKENAHKEAVEEQQHKEKDYYDRDFYGQQQTEGEVVSLG